MTDAFIRNVTFDQTRTAFWLGSVLCAFEFIDMFNSESILQVFEKQFIVNVPKFS